MLKTTTTFITTTRITYDYTVYNYYYYSYKKLQEELPQLHLQL